MIITSVQYRSEMSNKQYTPYLFEFPVGLTIIYPHEMNFYELEFPAETPVLIYWTTDPQNIKTHQKRQKEEP